MYRPPLTYKADYLYEAWYETIDYAYAYEWFRRQTPVSVGACSTVRKGNLIGRNLDWTYDESAEFVVHTDGVVGVANAIPGLTDAFVKSGADADEYRIVPFMLSDGMNKHGLVVTTLVVPTDKGDNSVVHPMELELEELCTLMLPRFVLDRFDDADSACGFLMRFVRLYHPKTLQDKHYDQHFVIADKHDTYCMEFVGGQYVVHDISDKPFVTNFHLSGVTFNADGSVYTPATGKASLNGITDNGSGLERYNLINSYTKDIGVLMRALSYTRAYQSHIYPAVPRWDTEFVGNGRTVDTPSSGYDDAQAVAALEYIGRSRDDGRTWHTVHSVVYDVQEKKLHLYAQENYDTQWEVSVMAEQTHIQRLRGDTAKNDNYTGLVGETTINTDSQSIRVHDGVMKGGYGTVNATVITDAYEGMEAPKDLPVGAHVISGDGKLDTAVYTENFMPYNTREILATSGAFTAPVTGWYKVTCIGGGGGGGSSNYSSGINIGGFSGSSGGISIDYKFLVSGTVVNYTVGAGGTGAPIGGKANRGGNTSFNGVIAGGGGFGHTPGTSYLDTIAGGSSNCGLVGFAGNMGYYGNQNSCEGASGAGFGGGQGFGLVVSNVHHASGYGGGGAGGEYNVGIGHGAGGNGYQGCVILEYYDPEKLAA